MTRETLRNLTAGEIAALQAYAAEHGRKWKAALLDDWMRAALTGELHALRNSHGPSWLMGHKLPREVWRCCACGGVTSGARAAGESGCTCDDDRQPSYEPDPQALAELLEHRP